LLEASDVPEVIRCVLHCMPEGVEGWLCSLEVLEVIYCVLLCMLEGVEGRLCSLEVWRRWRCRR